MRALTPVFCPFFRWVAVLSYLLTGASFAAAQSTILRGQVTAPYDATYNPDPDPMPNIVVFIAPPGVTLPDFTQPGFAGITGNSATSCDEQQTLLLGDPRQVPIAVTTTDYTGAFTLTSPALTALPAGDYTLVIQAGKWRHRQTVHLNPGDQTQLPVIRMPSAASANDDLPKIAVVTGEADTIECIFRQMGISNSEVTDPGGSGHIHLYPSSQTGFQGSHGSVTTGSSPTKTESDLMSSFSTLQQYDMLMFGCTGTSVDPAKGIVANQRNLAAYANQGGRVFATHYEFIWLNKPNTFLSAANWFDETSPSYPNSYSPENSGTGTIQLELDPTKTNSEITELAQWLQYRGYSTTYGQIPNVQNIRQDQSGIAASTQEWGYLLGPTYPGRHIGTPIMQFTFDTPLSAGTTAGATVSTTFNHKPTNFLLGDSSDTITLNVADTATVDAPGLTVTLSLPTGLTALSLTDASGNPAACDLSALTCFLSLKAGASDLITLKVAVPATGHAGQVSVTATVSGATLSVTSAACGRVMYNEYHVETGRTGASSLTYPQECGTALSGSVGVEKFLEFSLYNLSNFIPSGNSDTILIQGQANLAWQPKSPLYYTEPITDAETATSDVPGTFTYTVSPAYTGPAPDPGTYTITAAYAATDAADYLPGTLTRQVAVLPDPTQSTITKLVTPIFYGQEIGYTNGIDAQVQASVIAPGYGVGNTVVNGSLNVLIDGKLVCTAPGGQGFHCPDPPFLGWDAGVHNVGMSYSGSVDYIASTSPLYPVVINPDPTTTSLTASSAGLTFGSGVTFTSAVADAYTPAVGTVTFYDSMTPTAAIAEAQPNINPVAAGLNPVGSAVLAASSTTAALTLTNMLPGTHNISACYTSPVNASGTYNYLNSCSASVAVSVKLPSSGPLATVSLLKSSANPSAVGQAVSFTAMVETTGAFTQTPTGSVTFLDGGASIGTATLAGDGTAVLTTSTLAAGTHTITVQYAGTAALAASTSASLTQLVGAPLTPAPGGFLLLVDQNTVPVYVGSSAVVNVQIVPLTDFSQPVQLSCSGLPAQASCTFAETTVPAGGGKTQMLVSSGAPHACGNSTPYMATMGGRGLLSLAGLCGLTLCFVRRRRVLQGIALAGLLCLLPGVLTGCGGNCTDFGVKPGDYSFTVTATPVLSVNNNTSSKPYSTPATQAMTMHVHL